jgi:AhpD family alkylhydroperoxidase
MANSYSELNKRVHERMNDYAVESPDVMKGFMELHSETMADGALTRKEKELIALGIAICIRCDGCIAFHINDALKAGATHDEIADTIGVAILMGGRPSVLYGSHALDALKEFEKIGNRISKKPVKMVEN